MGHLQVEHFSLWDKPYNGQCYDTVVNEISCNIYQIHLFKIDHSDNGIKIVYLTKESVQPEDGP